VRLHALQYLRAAAALVVVYSHAMAQVPAYATQLPKFGAFGVDVFFVISGFIMVWIAKPGDTPQRFVVNRVRRIVPLYWFFTLLMALVLVALPNVFENAAFDWRELALSLAFLPYESTAHPGWLWPILAPGWSLNYEMYFYLAFALSLVLAPRYRVAGAIGLIVLVFALARLSDSATPAARFYGHDVVFEFVYGMLLAIAWQRGLRLSPALGTVLLIIGSVLLLLHLPAPRAIMFGVPALLVVAGSLYVRVPNWRWAVLLGDASYALYLSHLFTLGVLRAVLPRGLGDGPFAALAFVSIALVVCTLVSVVVHLVIDNWLLRKERVAWLRPAAASCGAAVGSASSSARAPTSPPTSPPSGSRLPSQRRKA